MKRPTRHSRAPRRQPLIRTSPFFWMVTAIIIAVIVVLGGLGLWLLGSRPHSESSPTVSASQVISATQAGVTLAPPTSIATSTPTPFPVTALPARNCQTIHDTSARTEPKQRTIQEPLPYGKEVAVTGVIVLDGLDWYQVTLNGTIRYVPKADLKCEGD